MNSAPFATVALAGHVISGNAYCTCGSVNCVCDPGEDRAAHAAQSAASDSAAPSDKGAPLDPVAGVMLLTLALLLGLRLRF